ncbi:MAG: hypothetical protein IT423_00500 [Pirellulaceae bacterium]|nr:hypothetical protein [Pirellulaceae bacterium]
MAAIALRHSLFWLVVSSGILAGSYGTSQTPKPKPKSQSSTKEMDRPYLMINSAIPGGFVAATIVKDADSFVEVTANLGSQEIGKYKRKVESLVYDACDRDLQSSDFANLKSPDTFEPTMPTITFGRGIGNDVSTIQMRTFGLRDVPEKARPFLESSKKAIDYVRQSKLRVIQGTVQSTQAKFSTQDAIGFEITLTNVGSEAVSISNPLNGESPVTAVVVALSKLAGNEASPPEVIEVRKNELRFIQRDTPDQPQVAGAKIRLLAEASLSMLVKKPLYLKPGQYRATVVLHFVNMDSKDGSEISGKLSLQAESFLVEQ